MGKKEWMLIFISSIVTVGLTYFIVNIINFNIINFNIIFYVLLYFTISLIILLINKFNLLNCTGLFLIFYTFFIGIAPIILKTKAYAYTFNAPIVIFMGLFTFFLGNLLVSYRKKNADIEINKYNITFNIEKLMKIAKILLIVSSGFWLKYMIQNYKILFSDLENGRVEAMQGNGKVLYFIYLSMLAVWIIFNNYIKYNKIKLKNIIILVTYVSIMLFTLGFRSRIAELFLIMILIYNYRNKIGFWKIIAVSVIGTVGILALYYIRIIISNNDVRSFKDLIENIIVVGNINLSYIFRVFPNSLEFQDGYTYIINFLMLKPGPDLDFTLWLKQALNISFNGAGVTPTILGEFYINFGYIGMYLGMFLIGIITKLVDKNTINKENSLLNSIITVYLARSITGGITNNLLLVLWFIFAYFVINKLCKEKTMYGIKFKSIYD